MSGTRYCCKMQKAFTLVIGQNPPLEKKHKKSEIKDPSAVLSPILQFRVTCTKCHVICLSSHTNTPTSTSISIFINNDLTANLAILPEHGACSDMMPHQPDCICGALQLQTPDKRLGCIHPGHFFLQNIEHTSLTKTESFLEFTRSYSLTIGD